jgi:ribosomal protein S18 acetylase RimI-like enzyme
VRRRQVLLPHPVADPEAAGLEVGCVRGGRDLTVALLVRNSYRVLGLYHGGALVGYCRAVSDGAVHAYLADVYVLEEHRGMGLGEAMVREMVETGDLAHARWMLHTGDMQPLYRKLGFGAPSERAMERPSG